MSRTGQAFAALIACFAAAGSDVITSLTAIHHLPVDVAERHLPVVAEGVVTNTGGWPYGLTVQDREDGVYVALAPGAPPVAVGQRVIVRGTTDPGRFAPMILAARIEPKGNGALPAPYPAKARELASGELDNRFVEVHGVVRATARAVLGDLTSTYMIVDTNPGIVHVTVSRKIQLDTAKLVGATIRASGVVAVEFNRRRQALGASVVVNRPEDISVLRMPAAGAMDGPATAISDIFRWGSNRDWSHRIKISGVLTLQRAGEFLILQDHDQAIRIESIKSEALPLGSRFDVAGFAVPSDFGPTLSNAVISKRGSPESIQPLFRKAAVLAAGDDNWMLVKLRARLIEVRETAAGVMLSLDDSGTRFNAVAPASASREMQRLAVGSELEICGINETVVDTIREPQGFRLLLRSPKDVLVLRGGPWLDGANLLWSALILAAAALLCALWALTLRSRVRAQTARIAESLGRETASARLHSERSRILELIGRNSSLEEICRGLIGLVTAGCPGAAFWIGVCAQGKWEWFGEAPPDETTAPEEITVASGSGNLSAKIYVRDTRGEAQRDTIEMCRESLALALEHRDLHEQLVQQSLADPLTQLPNRRSLDRHMDRVLRSATLTGNSCAVIVLDMDNFKSINDTFGHLAGDKVLQELAERFSGVIRKHDFVSRIGGDEFMAVLDRLESPEQAEELARRLSRQASRPIDISGIEIRPSLSIGVALYPVDGETAEALKHTADTRMYRSKMSRTRLESADPVLRA